MKVTVYAKYMVIETFEIEVDSEDQIRDEAWDVAYDFVSKYNTNMFTMLIGSLKKNEYVYC